MKKLILLVLLLSLILVLADCDSNKNDNQDSNTPVLSSLSPSSMEIDMPSFVLSAYGSKFTLNSKIVFNGKEKATTYLYSGGLLCRIDPDDTDVLSESYNLSSLQDTNVSVLVRNPSNEGGNSNSLNFTITGNHKFTKIINIASSTNNQSPSEPSIASDNDGNIYIVWAVDFWENANFIQTEIYCCSSKDGGKSWSQAINVSNNPDYGWGPKIITDKSGNLYVTWYEPTENSFKICLCKSTDGGITWSESINLLQCTKDLGYYPDIAIDTNGNVLVAWDGYTFIKNDIYKHGIYYRVSRDNGASWGAQQTLATIDSGYIFFTLATGWSGGINAAWWSSNDNNIYFRRTTNLGKTWSSPSLISTIIEFADSKPDIAEDPNGTLYAVWWDLGEIYFRSSSNGGASWSSPENLSNTYAGSCKPVIDIDYIGNINIAWIEQVNGYDGATSSQLYYIRSMNKGEHWSAPLAFSSSSSGFYNLEMSNDNNGNVNIVAEGSGGIYYTGSIR
jgi:hypothetical protein